MAMIFVIYQLNLKYMMPLCIRHEYEHFTGVMLKCGALLEQIMSSLVVNILHNQDLQPTDLTTHCTTEKP